MNDAVRYYENIVEYRARGIDFDLLACLCYNPQDGFDAADIERVPAVWEGANDGEAWRWVFRLKDDRYVFLIGWCDFTGWDCDSWANHVVQDTAEAAAQYARDDDAMRPLLALRDAPYRIDNAVVRADLLRQIRDGKTITWSETKDDEFGLYEKEQIE